MHYGNTCLHLILRREDGSAEVRGHGRIAANRRGGVNSQLPCEGIPHPSLKLHQINHLSLVLPHSNRLSILVDTRRFSFAPSRCRNTRAPDVTVYDAIMWQGESLLESQARSSPVASEAVSCINLWPRCLRLSCDLTCGWRSAISCVIYPDSWDLLMQPGYKRPNGKLLNHNSVSKLAKKIKMASEHLRRGGDLQHHANICCPAGNSSNKIHKTIAVGNEQLTKTGPEDPNWPQRPAARSGGAYGLSTQTWPHVLALFYANEEHRWISNSLDAPCNTQV